MCELIALNSSTPVGVRLSLGELARHGGETNIHADGWGVAFIEGRDAQISREPIAAARSPWVQCLQAHPKRTYGCLRLSAAKSIRFRSTSVR